MPDWRRYFVPGGTYFFTINTDRRRPIFGSSRAIELLGQKIRDCQARWPFTVHAIVLLPDHWHTLWSLPSGDDRYPARLGWIKKEFTKDWLSAGVKEVAQSKGRIQDGRRGVWQPKYWEHTLESEDEFEPYFDYIHFNPVKHGYVKRPGDWPASSFHRWIREGVYPPEWAADGNSPLTVDLAEHVGE